MGYVVARVGGARGARLRLFLLALGGGLFGAASDAALARLGLLTLTVERGYVLMASLWAMFAVSLCFSARSLARLGALTRAMLGALFGPLAYLGGERLGVLSLAPGAPGAVALEWAIRLAVIPRYCPGDAAKGGSR